MSVIRNRIDFDRNFTRMPNEWLYDPNLSARAKGVLGILMSHSDGWEITNEYLMKINKEGRDAMRKAVAELAEQGYLERRYRRSEDGKKNIGSYYELVGKPLRDGFSGAQESDRGGVGFSGAQESDTNKTINKQEYKQKEYSSAKAADGASASNSSKSKAKPNSKPAVSKKALEDRPDVESLCKLLRDLIVANGCREPEITDGWRTQCRLLLDKDGFSYETVEQIIRFSQRDQFWQSNILSMDKLRKQADRLRLKAQAQQQRFNQQPQENLNYYQSLHAEFSGLDQKGITQ